jgi:hypothetical protein
VKVKIIAVVIVPGKIIVGICFPNYNIDNRCPHVTLLYNEWAPKESNTVLENTCLGDKKPFASAYEELRENGELQDERKGDILEGKVKINRDD